MTDSRTRILRRVREALGRQKAIADIDSAFDRLARKAGPAVQPALTGDAIRAFTAAAEQSAAGVHHLDSYETFGQWTKQRAQGMSPAPSLVLSPNAADVAGYVSAFRVDEQVTGPNSWGIVRACAGIAETGTVVSTSEDCPAGLLFLVERLIVILDPSDIVAYQEDVWETLRQRFKGNMPRTVNFITGPSRTADVEQTLQLGAHGPRWVDCVLIE